MRTTSCGGVQLGNRHGTPSCRSSCCWREPSSWGLSEWPPCLRLCGLLPEAVVRRSGLAGARARVEEALQGAEQGLETLGTEAGGRSLGGVPTTSGAGIGGTSMGARRPEPAGAVCTPAALHVLCGAAGQEAARRGGLPPVPSGATQGALGAVPVAPTAAPFPTAVSELGQLPRDWQWGPDFQPAMLRWLSELQWLPRDDSLPEAHRQVSFLELALDFESYTGRPLPPTPQTRLAGGEMSLQEKTETYGWRSACLGRGQARSPFSRWASPIGVALCSCWGRAPRRG